MFGNFAKEKSPSLSTTLKSYKIIHNVKIINSCHIHVELKGKERKEDVGEGRTVFIR